VQTTAIEEAGLIRRPLALRSRFRPPISPRCCGIALPNRRRQPKSARANPANNPDQIASPWKASSSAKPEAHESHIPPKRNPKPGSALLENALAACRTEVYGVIANDGFVGAKVHRTLDRIQSALFRSLATLRLPVLGCF